MFKIRKVYSVASNAFGADPHNALFSTLEKMGAGLAMVELMWDVYSSPSTVSTGVGTTRKLNLG